MAQEMAETILNDFDFEEGKEVAVMLSSLGATPVMELYVLYDEVEKSVSKGWAQSMENLYRELCNIAGYEWSISDNCRFR
mgnify:CR=1 FL=1